MNDYTISKNENIMTFTRDHGDCYGGEHSAHIDTEGKTGIKLYNHIKSYLGKSMAVAAKRAGFCEQ